jgi:hypothetical protein
LPVSVRTVTKQEKEVSMHVLNQVSSPTSGVVDECVARSSVFDRPESVRGVRVVELGTVALGDAAASFLAEMGGEVSKSNFRLQATQCADLAQLGALSEEAAQLERDPQRLPARVAAYASRSLYR